MSDEEATVDQILERRRSVASRMSVSYMSDAKWRKALAALASAHPGGLCHWKILRDEEPIRGSLPHPGEVDKFTLDCSLLSTPFYVQLSYRDIEWLEIPAEVTWQPYENAPLSRRQVNLSAIRSALESVGGFELEESPRGLRIYGYRP